MPQQLQKHWLSWILHHVRVTTAQSAVTKRIRGRSIYSTFLNNLRETWEQNFRHGGCYLLLAEIGYYHLCKKKINNFEKDTQLFIHKFHFWAFHSSEAPCKWQTHRSRQEPGFLHFKLKDFFSIKRQRNYQTTWLKKKMTETLHKQAILLDEIEGTQHTPDHSHTGPPAAFNLEFP